MHEIRPPHHFAGYVAQVVPYQVSRAQLRRWFETAKQIWPDENELNVQITYLALVEIHPEQLTHIKGRLESR